MSVIHRLLAAAVVVLALVAVPTMLGAVRPPGTDLRFAGGSLATRGWETPAEGDATRMSIGVSIDESLTIVNTGTLPADYRLSTVVSGNKQFLGRLWLTARRRSDGAILFSGPVRRLRSLALGHFGTQAAQTLDLRLTLESTGSDELDNRLQGLAASVGLGWSATQA
jgi:hypothetical protein